MGCRYIYYIIYYRMLANVCVSVLPIVLKMFISSIQFISENRDNESMCL
jgi:hypothetical protein